MRYRFLLFLSAPIVLPAAIVLALVLAPAGTFLWLTFRRVAGIDNAFVGWVYALLATTALGASIAWPIVAIYGANQL